MDGLSARQKLEKIYQYIPYFEKKNSSLPKILCTYKVKRNRIDPFEDYYFAEMLNNFLDDLNEVSFFLPFELVTYSKEKELEVYKSIRNKEFINFSFFEIRAILTEIFNRSKEAPDLIPRAIYNNVFLNSLKQLKYLHENDMIDFDSLNKNGTLIPYNEYLPKINEKDKIITELIAEKIKYFKHEYKYLKIEEGKYFSRIAGVFFHYLRDDYLPGMEAELILKRETSNPQDKNAIAIHSKEGIKFGYLPKEFAEVLAPLIDEKINVKAYIADFKMKPLDAIIFVEIEEENKND
ncbi:HIRAN domain-containing protein [Acholeplasma sp. OttesenSCG-928-E16]|nr:HIRAN domain-containing protein [Acholeplasma sp. OttesenSCG-928-E16]